MSTANLTCPHANYSVSADIGMLGVKLPGGATKMDPTQLVAQVWIKCSDCGMPFEILGVPVSNALAPNQATVPPHKLCVMLPIRPSASRMIGGSGR